LSAKNKLRFLILLLIFLFPANAFSSQLKELYPSTQPKSLNLIFCGLNYPDQGLFLKDIAGIKEKLFLTKPFDEFKDLVNISYITMDKGEEGRYFKPAQGMPPLNVRIDLLNNISKTFGVYKLIIIDAEGSVSCAELSLPDKLSLIILGKARYKDEGSFAKGFLHELGHSLGLRDECVDCSQLCFPGPPNCATTKEEAEKWWGGLVGKGSRVNYIAGCCGNKDYIRPTITSLMNDPDRAKDFGPVNERYLRNRK